MKDRQGIQNTKMLPIMGTKESKIHKLEGVIERYTLDFEKEGLFVELGLETKEGRILVYEQIRDISGEISYTRKFMKEPYMVYDSSKKVWDERFDTYRNKHHNKTDKEEAYHRR